jgi:hypothetical protein
MMQYQSANSRRGAASWPKIAARWILRSRQWTAWARVLPDFIVVGAQRAGTTSLYNYLLRHPRVAPALVKEVHYFDLAYHKGEGWYRAHFLTRLRRASARRVLTGEASPYYLFHPRCAERIAGMVPRAKLVVLLRNPVDRAYSHYYHEVQRGREPLSFEEAIEREAQRLQGEEDRLLQEECSYSFSHQHYSYLSRGIYVDQLKRFQPLFPREQLLVLKSETFFAEPKAVLNQVLTFLGLSTWEPDRLPKYNMGTYRAMDRILRGRLTEFFRPHNERLYKHLGVDLGW